MKTVAIIGLGYVGLPLAALCAEKKYRVYGVDVNPEIVRKTNAGISHIKDAALEKKLACLKGKIPATTDAAQALKNADIAIVCVPTPVDENKHPDLRALRSASEAIAKSMRKGMLVVVESTVYPGTLEEVVQPILESSGLRAGKDFFLAHCPERIDPGNKKWTLEKIPRVLGGLTPACANSAKKFYESVLDAKVTVLDSLKAAEAVKITENAFRDVNIAFVNELAMSLDVLGIDIIEVIRGASTKPFGYMPFYPGPGVGGHCIAVDPYYLIEKAQEKGFSHEFLKLARKINDSMAGYVELKVLGCMSEIGIRPESAVVAFFGLSYKPGVGDTRESPALRILDGLRAKGIKLRIFDPLVKEGSTVKSVEEALKGAQIALLATHHPVLVNKLGAKVLKDAGIRAVVDARNALDKAAIENEGMLYKGIGR